MIIRTMSLLEQWREDAVPDPFMGDLPLCSLVFRWSASLAGEVAAARASGDDLTCGILAGRFALRFSVDEVLPVPVRRGEPEISDDGQLMTFGAERIEGGVWMFNPSLHLPGVLHAYLTVHGVPDPAPWDRPDIIIATALPPLYSPYPERG